MDNLTYIKDSRNGNEAAVVNGIARFQMSSVGVVSRSDMQDGEWSDYRPIPKSVKSKTEFYEYMITVAQHAFVAQSGVVDSRTSETRVIIGEGVVMHTCVNGDRQKIGYQLSPEINEHIPEEGRNEDGWYEVGPEISKVAAFVPDVFGQNAVDAARKFVSEYFPELAIHFEEPATPSMGR